MTEAQNAQTFGDAHVFVKAGGHAEDIGKG